MPNDLQRQSEVITALRAPLMLLVTFIHIPLAGDYYMDMPLAIPTSIQSWYYYISKVISYTLGHAAVPTFFAISGYYMFAKPKPWLDRQLYSQEMKKRVSTLLLPYLIWCTIPMILNAGRDLSLQYLGRPSTSQLNSFGDWCNYIYNAYIFSTVNDPLWYVRDLIVLSILAPLFYLMGKRTPWLIIFIYIPYFLNYKFPFASGTGYFFFGIGAIIALQGKNLLALAERQRAWLIPLCTLLTLSIPFAFGHKYQWNIIAIYIPLMVGAILAIGGLIRDHLPRLHRLNTWLYPSVFFIYIVHEVLILPAVKGAFYKFGLLETPWGYFLCGGLVWGISFGLYKVLERYSPKTLAILVGGRA